MTKKTIGMKMTIMMEKIMNTETSVEGQSVALKKTRRNNLALKLIRMQKEERRSYKRQLMTKRGWTTLKHIKGISSLKFHALRKTIRRMNKQTTASFMEKKLGQRLCLKQNKFRCTK
eukprot:9410035-Heterocapsa_arctica.AAC.1